MKFKVDFIGIGAARSGSTWLSECLREHPEIFIPRIKEISFFNRTPYNKNYSKGLGWYKSFFKKASKNKIKGEYSTHYMINNDAPKLIKKHFPNVKILACLRNPADMLYSFYWWRRSTFDVNEIPDTFEKALEIDPEYKLRRMYYKQLKPYFDIFGKNNIKIVLFDDIRNKPIDVLKDIYEFLGVDSTFRPTVIFNNVNMNKQARSKYIAYIIKFFVIIARKLDINIYLRGLTRTPFIGKIYSTVTEKSFKYPDMKKSTRKKINKMVYSDLEKLEKLINRDLSIWKA